MPYRFDVLISKAQIEKRVAELAAHIDADYAPLIGKGSLLVIGILKGSFVFTADLLRQLSLPAQVDFLEVASYQGTESTGYLRWLREPRIGIEGRHVLVVEDIVDTGVTMNAILHKLKENRPASLKLCSLLHKPSRQKVAVPIDYKGFTIEDYFVIGYGLDYEEKYRQISEIVLFSPERT